MLVAADAICVRRVVIWITISIAVACLLGLAALLVAIRFAPGVTIPRLPISTAVWLRNVTTGAGQDLIFQRLHENASEPFVVASLTGSVGAQLQILDALSGGGLRADFWGQPGAVRTLLLELCSHPDARLRAVARSNFPVSVQARLWSKGHSDQVERGHIRPGPGAWIPDRAAVLALYTLDFLGAGYDHKMPSACRQTIQNNLDVFLAGQDEMGCFAADDRDHAIITAAVAEAYGMTNDSRLEEPVLHAVAWLLRDDDSSAEERWSANTDLAVWDVMAMKSVVAGGLLPHSLEILQRFQRWMARNKECGQRCYEDGRIVDAVPVDALAQQAILLAFIGNDQALTSMPKSALIPQPGLSDVTNYWLTLALMRQDERNFAAQVAPYKEKIIRDQNWDAKGPDLGCLSPQSDPASHALRLLLLDIYNRRSPVYSPPSRAKP